MTGVLIWTARVMTLSLNLLEHSALYILQPSIIPSCSKSNSTLVTAESVR